MKILKVSSSGQITLPKIFRKKYDTNLFSFVISDDQFIVSPAKFSIIGMENWEFFNKKKKTLKDLKKGIFSSKQKNVDNLADKIDDIIYK